MASEHREDRSAQERTRRFRLIALERLLGLVLGLVASASVAARAGDWPTYRHDIARSGVTSEEVRPPLSECWVFRPAHPPEPAWGHPNPRPVGGWYGTNELPRVHFDDAYHVVAAGGAVYFGSSADGKVYALDAATGKERWSARTGGPIRLAPTVWRDKVYLGSDDGFVYCLRAGDGKEQWKFRAALDERKLLGSGKMISRWPIRTGVLVDEGVAYFGAGIFPAEGVAMYAVGADDGKLIWRNDTCGEAPQSRISPQGYLLASADRLFAPLARVSPAAFDRKDGRLLYEAYIEHIIGGAQATLSGSQLFTGTEELIGYDEASHRSQSAWFWGHRLVVTPEMFYVATGRELFAVNRATYGAASLRRKGLLDRKRALTRDLQAARQGPESRRQQLQADMDALNGQLGQAEQEMAGGEIWRVPCECDESLVLAGNVVFAGGEGSVVAFDASSGDSPWSAKVGGKARGLAIAESRLFVSSASGAIHCFGPEGAKAVGAVAQRTVASPFPRDEMTPVFEAAAERIVRETGIERGYCLLLGCGTGRLALELAKRTELTICGADPDGEKVEAARQALDAAGLYGARVHLEQADLANLPFSDYFANLVVSEEAIISGRMPGDAKEAFRMLKPLGGTILIGQPAAAAGRADRLEAKAIDQWLAKGGLDGGRVVEQDGTWLELRRGPLPGAGSWTHQYANPGNTTCSDDQLVRCPLGLLWFGGPGPAQMAERHRRAAAPLATGGRVFILGEGSASQIGAGDNAVMAYDAYNGLKLWEREIRGALRVSVTHDAGNSAVNADSLFIAVGDECLRLDAATGETRMTYKLPPATDGKARLWGYVGVVGDLLYGSRTAQGRTADCVFALDLADGRLRWKHEGKSIAQGAIALGDGRVFLADAGVTDQQRLETLAERLKQRRRSGTAESGDESVYRVVALDALSGRPEWEKTVEVTGAVGGANWCSLGAIYDRNVLLLFGVFLDGHYWKQFFAGEFDKRRVVALSGKDGGLLWEKPIGYRVRPLVIGDTLHAEPWAYDLHTGKQQTRIHPVTGQEEAWQFARPGHHCGCPAASPHTMLFRSYTLGWYDLEGDYGTQHFGSQRPGCWINFIPANGLLMVPEASSGCLCPFPNVCTLVFKSSQENKQWAYFSQPGPMTPVKRLGLALGAPGDRKDSSGALWLGYPRPTGSLVLRFDAGVGFYPGGGYTNRNPVSTPIAGAEDPWLLASAARGLRQCVLPLLEEGDGTAEYRVRLAFADPDNNQPGARVFDVKLQGKVVLENFDIVEAAGGGDRAVFKEFGGIEVRDNLVIELAPKGSGTAPEQAPILQAIEVVRERVTSLGSTVPDFLLSTLAPEASGELRLANLRETPFEGTLEITAPEGFAVEPKQAKVSLAAGGRTAIALAVALRGEVAAGKYELPIKLVTADGAVELERSAHLEHLGRRARIVLTPTEDAFVSQRYPDRNQGTGTTLLVDGGDAKMGDSDHSLALLKFRLDVPGKPIEGRLRIHNAGNPTGNSGRVCLADGAWTETGVTYATRPKASKELARLGPVSENQAIEVPIKADLSGKTELSLIIDPTSTDGVDYLSRESAKPPELTIEYEPAGASGGRPDR